MKRWTTLGSWLVFLAITLAPLVPLGYVTLSRQQGVEAVFAPGAISRVHAQLACQDCHAAAWRAGRRALREDSQAVAAMDRACAQCHGGLLHAPTEPARALALAPSAARPPQVRSHNDCQVGHRVSNCAECHPEHHGPRLTLRAGDAHCIACHTDLRTTTGQRTFTGSIRNFNTDHPPFGQWRPKGLHDSGALHFNHQAHLNMNEHAVRGIGGALRRLKAQECAYCHEPDSTGRNMQPIRYEKHCADCHPLSIPLSGGNHSAETRTATEDFVRRPAPHTTPVEVRRLLQSRLSVLALQHPEFWEGETSEPEFVLPGGARVPSTPRTPRAWVAAQQASIERLLFDGAGGCRFCHVEKTERPRELGLPRYEWTSVPTRWFPHAQFSHVKHGQMQCRDCHRAGTSRQASDVLMPTIDQCKQCHQQGNSPSKARADCLECHRYHAPVLQR
ncbi:MAG: hypothetical protein K2R98_11460 [Gemmataceae bacterium]|nr:hypothetical protein [Gemmataceae bacterium]